MHTIRGTFFALFATLAIASVAGAQSIAGTVRDSSGAVLPGVTVEASSAALIEKARSVVTDANGQFQIIDLRPGTYDVTFTLPGFSTVARKGLELSGGGVTTVNAKMRVGGVQETITVTGESPVVDVQTSTSREQILSNEFIRALPAARGYGNYLAGVPGISGTGLSSGAATSNNFFLDDELRSYGFADLPALIKSWDTNFAFSGPILRNRIWFYSNARTIGTYQDVPGR